MISFIIIGRNEGWKLSNSIKSIEQLIQYNTLNNTEIIYVDSDSSDNSIELARSHNLSKIYQITGEINAAVARNVGANAAKGDILFFMDGDIELSPFYFDCITLDKKSLVNKYVVGFLDDVNYTSEWKWINQTSRNYRSEKKDREETTVGGGIFIIEKKTWIEYEGMDEKLRRTQDRDFSLRMATNGIRGIRKAEIFGLHHTIPYKDKKRMWKMVSSGQLMFRGIFIRKHIFNKNYTRKLFTEEFPLILLLFSVFFLVFNIKVLFLLYFISIVYKNRSSFKNHFLSSICHRFIQDLIVIFSIFFVYPKLPKYKIQLV